jgi:hypothetical protein
MYRLARNHVGLVTNHPWNWYLNNAYRTIGAMMKFAPYYTQFGQMEGTVFLEILKDLQREGWTKEAADLEAMMKGRTDIWIAKGYPFAARCPGIRPGRRKSMLGRNTSAIGKRPGSP